MNSMDSLVLFFVSKSMVASHIRLYEKYVKLRVHFSTVTKKKWTLNSSKYRISPS